MAATITTILFFNVLFVSYGYTETIEELRHYNAIEKLHTNLLKNYNSHIRPAANHSHHVDVKISLYLTHFAMEEFDAKFELNGYISMSWKDDRLIWDPEEYDGVNTIHVENSLLWKPDLVHYNSIVALENVHFASVFALVLSDGSVINVPLVNFQSVCPTNVLYWPFDQQKCKLAIGSWTHDGYEIRLSITKDRPGVNISDASVIDHWKITEATATVADRYYPCCEAPYPVAEFVFTLQRYSPTFHYTVIGPAIMIVFLTLAAFFLPPSSSEKFVISMIDMMVLAAYLIYFDSILHGKDHVALIVIFYSNTLILVGTSVIVSVATIELSRRRTFHGPPAIVMSCLNGVLGRLLCLNQESAMVKTDQPLEEFNEQSTSDEAEKVGFQNQWPIVAQALNRLLFIIYAFIFVILMISYL